MEIMLVYALLTSAAFYLGSRAMITRWLWSRYPPRFARFMDCAACTGFWYGLIAGIVGTYAIPEDLTISIPKILRLPLIVALCSIVWTPIVAGYMQLGFERLGTTVGDDDGG